MQTAIDTLLATFLGFCVAQAPLPDRIGSEPYTITVYNCPLVKAEGVFYVWKHVCPDPSEQHTVALLDPAGAGWALNEFGGVDVAHIGSELMAVYRPACQLHPEVAGVR